MQNNITLDLGLMSSGAGIGTGTLLWFGQNATAIGAIVAILTLFTTTLFLFLNYLTNKKYHEEDCERELIIKLLKRATPEERKTIESLLKE